MFRVLLGLVWGLALGLLFLLPFILWLVELVGEPAGFVVFALLSIVGVAGVGLIAVLLGRNDRRILWPLALVSLWASIWVLYTPSLLFTGPADSYGDGPSPHEVFLFFERGSGGGTYLFSIDDYSSGGVYDSVPLAAAIGGILCAAFLFVGYRRTRLRVPAVVGFIASYVLVLIILWTVVSPALWGPVLFGTD